MNQMIFDATTFAPIVGEGYNPVKLANAMRDIDEVDCPVCKGCGEVPGMCFCVAVLSEEQVLEMYQLEVN